MKLRRILLSALAALFAAGASPAAPPFPAEPDPLDPDPDRRPQEVCILYDARVVRGFNLSRARASSLRRLLASGGVPASVFPAREIDAALSAPCFVAHLVHFEEAALPPGAEARLRAFVARGGRLVAWGCSGPTLEGLFGVKGGAFTSAGAGRTWSGFEPVPGALPFAPAGVENAAAGVIAFEAAAPGVSPAAFWRAPGRAEPGPAAALRASAGFWIGRVLYDDGSGADRARFAASLCCALRPALARGVAESLRARLYAPFGAADAAAAEAACFDPAAPRARNRAVREAFRAHRRRMEEARGAAERAAPAAAGELLVAALWRETTALEEVYATARPVGADRGARRLCVWEKTGYGPFDGDWDRAAAALAEAGVSDAILFAGSLAGTVAAVPGVPPTPERARRGGRDPFPDAVRACHARGIRVHAWFPVLQFDQAPAARRAAFEAAGRLLHKPDGSGADWLDPSAPANLDELGDALSWIAANEGVDGLCLDYVRFPDFPTREPHPPGALEALLRGLRARVLAAAPGKDFATAVFGSAVEGHGVIGQNWGAWLDAGLVDYCYPMNYVPDTEGLRRLLDSQRARLPKSVCGIGATSHAALLSGPELLEQLRAAWRAGCAGAAVYPFDRRFVDELLPVLRAAR